MKDNEALLAIILGAVQGLTEFLPVSSSGHLIVVSWLLSGQALPLTLNIALHFGTLIAVVAYFWRDWLHLAQACLRRLGGGQRSFAADTLLPALLLGSVPAAVIGLSCEAYIEDLFHNPRTVALPLLIVGFVLWGVDRYFKNKRPLDSLTIKDGFLIGLAQACALIPGVSRSGATITAARSLGFDREAAARFSFLLGTPAMGGAALLHSRDFIAHASEPSLYLGVLASCVVGCLAIRFFLYFSKRFGFLAFALYRAALALCIWYLVAPV